MFLEKLINKFFDFMEITVQTKARQ